MSIEVAVAVIVDEQQRILITQRPFNVPHGGCWEFPGGKLEADEPSGSALIREIKEEVGLDVLQYKLLSEINHQYSDKEVKLIIFLVSQFAGAPSCLEGQLAMKWVYPHELNHEHFPEANRKVIAMVQNYLCCNESL
ncbi:8-oxo-dGTP diphosphatase MutT [Legionella qingyii]|uniref:8-oxo-dGTP diphosphatase n=1 Tax=Legionella qingyii TaxID=2184757 RepID=A0A317TY73_9GAMM|nr:8-oxo-dGTP diphosphatase MutT [Legionella qingyii]PWY54431.1 8-oxo-dGTP diphosphatase MutT [Legionella qingyii]RUR22838.1 8-oxo-dGTP diphosphatase MutT [Legionella qingyii]RUR23013.1 8-oxo-dGTP diphosphatase MutT [Legionella qingyii]